MLWYNIFSNAHGFEDGGILRIEVLSQVASHIAIVRNQVSFYEWNVCAVVAKNNQPLICRWMVWCSVVIKPNTDMITVVKCNLTKLTTKSASVAPWPAISLWARNLLFFPHPSPLCLFHCLMSVTGACLPSRAWGLMAGLPGLASHGSGLNLVAGCQ